MPQVFHGQPHMVRHRLIGDLQHLCDIPVGEPPEANQLEHFPATRGQVLQGPWFGGFPVAAAIQVYGLWLGPLLLVTLAYGLTFDLWELREKDLRRFDARRRSNGGDTEQ